MRYENLLVWRHRTITLSIVAAVAAVGALLVLSPPLAQGSPAGVTHQNSPATIEECREEMVAGHAVRCTANRFSVNTIRPNGEYHINWSAWADQHTTIDRYSIQRLRFLYRSNFTREDDGNAVDYSDYTVPDVNSCRPWAAERDAEREVTRWAWSCSGISNVREDPLGEPTSIEQLEDYSDYWTEAHWTGSLVAPGRKHDVPVQALMVPGNRDEPHADNPQGWRDRLTTQQVEDGTHDLLASEIEMHLYIITVHFDDGSVSRHYDLVDGSSFADR